MMKNHRRSRLTSLIIVGSLMMTNILPALGGEPLAETSLLLEEDFAEGTETTDIVISDASVSEAEESLFPEDETEAQDNIIMDDLLDPSKATNDDLPSEVTADGIFEDEAALLDGFGVESDEEITFSEETRFDEEEDEGSFADIFEEELSDSEKEYEDSTEALLLETPEDTLTEFPDREFFPDLEEEAERSEEFLPEEEESEEETLFVYEEETEVLSDALLLLAEDEATTVETGVCGDFCEWSLEQINEGEYLLRISRTEIGRAHV